MTMVHREEAYLALWLKHYEPMFGRENLYILTHGGDPRIVEMAAGCRLVYLPRLSVDGRFNINRFGLLNAYANFLVAQYDGVVAGDVDELVFVDPALGISFTDFAEEHRKSAEVLWVFGLNLFERRGDGPLEEGKPVLAQRRHARCEHDYCKPLVVFKNPEWTVGYHSAMATPVLPTGLYMVHLHHFSRALTEQIAEQRQETLAENPQILDSRAFRKRWWGQRMGLSRQYLKNMSAKPVEDLDDRIDDLLAHLRSHVVQSRWGGRGYQQMVFEEKPDFTLRLPERFAQVI
ncbi:MAG: hypothetical protein HC844_18550 [Tabrizicola sp.]|nr:hypothetical protein [Tabrizicola sp.]